MNSINELNWNELNHSYQPSDFSFQTTEEVESVNELVEQEDAIEAIRKGLAIESQGYNLYISGVVNKKMEAVIVDEVKKRAASKERPMALGYVYNFSTPEEPMVVKLQGEDILELKNDLQELRAFILQDMPMLLEQDEVQEKQASILEEFEKINEKYFMNIAEQAEKSNIQIRKTEEGIRFAPLGDDGVPLSKEAFFKLPEKQQEMIMEKISELQLYTDELLELVEKKEKVYLKMYNEVEQEVILREIGSLIKELKEKYKAYSVLQSYFNAIAEELLAHLELLASYGSKDETLESGENRKEAALALISQEVEHMVKNYDVNILSLAEGEGAPVICDRDYPQLSLEGRILLDTESNVIYSSFMHIRPGLFHYANGGYLIVHMQDLLERPNGWQQLKAALRTEKMYVEGNEEMGIALAKSLKPQAADVKVKVILIGSQEVYDVLKEYDESFSKMVKVKVNFNDEISTCKHKVTQLAGAVKEMLHEEGMKPVTTAALLRVLEYGHRKVDHPMKISSDVEWLMDFFREAQYHCSGSIDVEAIEKCIAQREQYERKIKERLDESLKDGTYLIDTRGAKVGQINGLAVYAIGDLSFGRPIRITATTYRGKQGIVDIENEARLSGSIHTKGIHIITGFLGNEFAQDMPLSLNCNICFEQSYMGVDGDSASCAELCAILSSLSNTPIFQNIAVTGSVNQFGEIQPVGGINEKIEGFFKICKQKGLTGQEGVMIPRKNTKELLLSSEVVEAVKNQTFHIYAISDIWEGTSIMMGEKKETIKDRVQEKLTRFNQ